MPGSGQSILNMELPCRKKKKNKKKKKKKQQQEAEEERKDKEEVLASPFVLLSYK